MFKIVGVVLLVAVSAYAVVLAGVQARSIPGVDVIVKKNPGSANSSKTTTDANGKFTLNGLDAGSYTLTFTILAAQQVPEQTTGKTYTDSKSNTAARTSVGSEDLFTFKGWPYEFRLKSAGVTYGTGTITKIRSAIVIEIPITVTGNGTIAISGIVQSNEVIPPPSETPSSR